MGTLSHLQLSTEAFGVGGAASPAGGLGVGGLPDPLPAVGWPRADAVLFAITHHPLQIWHIAIQWGGN